ncbi:MAG: PEP-CTERM sorting domain-containing protein [Planctomycetota bacterium]
MTSRPQFSLTLSGASRQFKALSAIIIALSLSCSVIASTETITPPTFSVDESVTFTAVNSNFAMGDGGNDTRTHTFTGGVVSPDVRVTGTLTEVDLGTFAGEANISIAPLGLNLDPAGSATGYTGSFAVDGIATGVSVDPAGLQTFEFYESFVDDSAGPDQTWDSVTIEFGELTDPGGRVVDNGMFALGVLPADGSVVSGPGQGSNAYHTNVADGLDFFTLEIPAAVGPGGYLNLTTSDALTGDTIDTEIFLFDSAGMLVATDDDGGAGTYSQLSFGIDDPLVIDPAAGEDGATLPAGMYTAVIGGFNTTVGSDIASLVPGTASGDYNLDVAFAVPEPSTFALLFSALLGLMMVRRSK